MFVSKYWIPGYCGLVNRTTIPNFYLSDIASQAFEQLADQLKQRAKITVKYPRRFVKRMLVPAGPPQSAVALMFETFKVKDPVIK